MCGKPHWKSSIARRQNLSLPIPFSNDTVLLIKQLFHCFDQTFLQCSPYDSVVTSSQPVTVNGAVDTDLLLSGQGIERGYRSLLSCRSLLCGLIRQMGMPMTDWQHPLTLLPTRFFLICFISFLLLLLVLLFILRPPPLCTVIPSAFYCIVI